MCNHNFMKTKKTNVYYCSLCYCLSINKIPLLTISSNLTKTFSMDPLLLKFVSNKYEINLGNYFTIEYLKIRKYAINFLKMQSEFFSIPKEIFYKALNYVDNIYLKNNIPILLLEKICIVCLSFSLQFNECNLVSNELIDIKKFENYVKNQNVNEIKILCLKYLDYDLGKFSIMDYIDLFFSIGIIYPDNTKFINIYEIYFKCLKCLDIIIEDNNILKFSNYIMALTIIKKFLEIHNTFNDNIFQNIYGIKFYKEKYVLCEQNLNNILSNYNLCNYNIINLNYAKKGIHIYNLTPKNTNQSTVENSSNNDSFNTNNSFIVY